MNKNFARVISVLWIIASVLVLLNHGWVEHHLNVYVARLAFFIAILHLGFALIIHPLVNWFFASWEREARNAQFAKDMASTLTAGRVKQW